MGVKITDRDNGYAKLQKWAASPGATFSVGVNDAPHLDFRPGARDLRNDQIGAFHEFGQGKNPERSFLRAWLDDESNWLPQLEKELGANPSGFADHAVLERFAKFCVDSIKARMRAGVAPPILASTLNRKTGGDTPLIDTEQLIDAIEYEIGRGT